MLLDYAYLSLCLLLGLWLVLPQVSVTKMFWRAVVLLPLIPVQVFYLYWRVSDTLNEFVFTLSTLWQYVFLLSEIFVITYVVWQCIVLTRFTDRSSQCDELVEKRSHGAKRGVDLFIPTHSESKTILVKTIAAAKTDNYSNLTIWICDDSNRNWLRELCVKEGVRYLNRPVSEAVRTKAGNLHWSIPHGSGDYVVCLDADFRLTPQFITRLTSFFSDSDIGLVQAPQHFRNLDPVQRNLLGGSAWTEEQRFFFDVSLPSRDAWNNALCVGSCWASRRQVIDDLGGFPVDSIVEDVYFGYRVKALGYKTVYLNEQLATGLAAEDTPSYIVQRSRWCLGAITLLRDPHGPIRCREHNLTDRVFYAEIACYWITHLHLFLLLIAPVLYGFFGYTVFNCTAEELFTILIPKNIVGCAVFYWISSGRCMPLVTPVQRTLCIFHTIPAIFKGLFAPRSGKFHVTRKDITHSGRTIHWRIAAPFIALGVLTVIATTKTFLQNYSEFYWSDYSAYNALLSAYSLVVLFLCCLICVDKPLKPDEEHQAIPTTGSWLKTSMVLTRRVFT